MAAKKELFLSYGRETEVIYFVKRLKEDLQKNGFSVWLDCDDISSGSDWHGAIGTALDNCKAVIPVVTNKYVASRFCKGELYTADSDKKLIFPIFLEDVDLSASELSRGVKYIIAGINWTFFRSGLEDYSISLTKLMQGMKENGLGQGVESTDSEATDSGSLSHEMAQLHLSSEEPPPSAPPPAPRASSPLPPLPATTTTTPGPYPGGYNNYTSPPHPYLSPPPSHNPQMPVPPGPPPAKPYPSGPSYPASGATPYPAESVMTTPPHSHSYHVSPTPPTTGYYPGAGGVHQTPPTNPAHQVSPHGLGFYPPPPGANVCQTPPTPTSYYQPPNPSQYPPTLAPNAYTSPPHSGYYPNVHQTPPSSHSHQTNTNYYPAPPPPRGHAYQSPPSGHAYQSLPGHAYQSPPSGHGYQSPPPGHAYQSPPGHPYQSPPPGHAYQSPPSGHAYPVPPSGPSPYNTSEPPPPYSLPGPLDSLTPSVPAVKKPSFKVGMKLEAVDRRFPYFVCVATVMDKRDQESKILIHFDGWGADYNYWCKYSDVELHPAGWCEKNGWELQAPQGQAWNGWSAYLSETHSEKAPIELFSEAQLSTPCSLLFEPGMRLEAKDSSCPSQVCAAAIIDVRPGEVKVHYDGWGSEYDFWCSSASNDIHPCMWSSKNLNKQCQPPKGHSIFKWSQYLADPNRRPAPAHLFNEAQRSVQKVSSESDVFQAGMRLEAKDRLNPTMVAVATVADIKDGQLLIHFDGWTSKYDYWCAPDCPDIHPVGWCEGNGRNVHPPRGMGQPFSWSQYLSAHDVVAAPKALFTKEQSQTATTSLSKAPAAAASAPKQVLKMASSLVSSAAKSVSGSKSDSTSTSAKSFKAGMKLEAKDRANPALICVATITKVNKKGQLLIYFDGWSNVFDYWCDPTTTDIHPIGWCQQHGHKLQKPSGFAGEFSWDRYLKSKKSVAAPASLFTAAQM